MPAKILIVNHGTDLTGHVISGLKLTQKRLDLQNLSSHGGFGERGGTTLQNTLKGYESIK